MTSVPHILDNLQYYSEAYNTYTRYSSRIGAIGDWVEESFGATVVEKLAARNKGLDTIRVLGIGSGAGNIDCAMIDKLLLHFPTISNTIVEPSEAQINLFKKRIEEKGELFKSVTFDWRQETLNEYLNTEGAVQSKKFHFIHAVHVLYYAEDLKRDLQILYDRLEPGGVLFIIMISAETTTVRVHQRMNQIVENFRSPILTVQEIQAALDSLGIDYTSGQVPRYVHGFNKLFEDESADGRHILDFFTHSKDFRSTASDKLREGVLEYLKSPSCAVERDGEMMFFRHWGHITVTK